MAQTCGECGRPYPDHGPITGEFVLDADSPDTGPGSHPTTARKSSRLPRWIGGAVVVWLVASVGIGLFRTAGPQDIAVAAMPTAEPTAVPSPTPDVTEVEAPRAAGIDAAPTSVPSAQAHDADALAADDAAPVTDGAGTATDLAKVAGATEGAATEPVTRRPASGLRMLQRQLARQSVAASIAYATSDGIAIITMDTLEVLEVSALTGPVDVDPGALVLATARGPLIVDPAGPAVTQVPIDGDLVVNEESGESYVLINGAEGESVVLSGGSAEAIETSPDARLISIEGFGVVAIYDEQDGPTAVAAPGGFELLSVHPVITANRAGRVEARCDTPVQCTTVIVDGDDGEWAVSDDFIRLGDRIHLAPDAAAILRVTPGGYSEVFTADGWTSWVSGEGMQDPVWAPDSSFIAWIDLETEPALKVMFPETRDWINVPLADIAAPLPLTAQLVIF